MVHTKIDSVKVVAYGGLGNRINEMLNGLFLNYIGIKPYLNWQINEHCPFDYQQIFDNGVFSEVECERETINHQGQLGEYASYCSYWYPGNIIHGRLVRESLLIELYKRLLNKIKAWPDARRFDLAVHYRGYGTYTCKLDEFVLAATRLAYKLNNKFPDRPVNIFLVADHNRNAIWNSLVQAGFEVTIGMAPEMTHDKDRSNLGATRAFMSDYLTINKTPIILTSSSFSTITDPARALGSKIYHVGPPRTDPVCWFVNNMPLSFLQA